LVINQNVDKDFVLKMCVLSFKYKQSEHAGQ
jgi:hypothetical protein